MMRIPELKPYSVDFKSEKEAQPINRHCDVPGCPHAGDHKAPKSRALDEYYYFCVDHVREYNNNWNYFEGMNQKDIEQHMYNTMTWDRPTWASTMAGIDPDQLRARVYEGIRMDGFSMGGGYKTESDEGSEFRSDLPAPEVEAMATLGLEPPLTWSEIQKQYKTLVKKHHPDVSDNKEDDIELIKKINLAYSILRIAYQKYEKLEPRS